MTDEKNEYVDTSKEDREYEELLKTYEDEEDNAIPELYFRNPDYDPYAKCEFLPDESKRHDHHFDDEGRIVVKNLEAYWLPEMKLVEEIDGTIYTVTGSYEGTETLNRKLSRIMLHNLEDSERQPRENMI